MNCPVCKSDNVKHLKTIKMAQSPWCLYGNIEQYFCNDCFHEYNRFYCDSEELEKFYKETYLKYVYKPIIKYDEIEVDKETLYISQNNINDWVDSLVSLNNYFWVDPNIYKKIILDNVLEHCWDLETVFNNIKKISKSNCELKIIVPNTNKDDEFYSFSERLIKEHIQHFCLNSIEKLLKLNGFTIDYCTDGNLIDKRRNPLMQIIKIHSKKTINGDKYCYGASRELLYFMENNDGLKYNVTAIIDDTKDKIGKEINDIRIINSNKIPYMSKDDTIYITSLRNIEVIRQKILDMGFKGMIRDDLTI